MIGALRAAIAQQGRSPSSVGELALPSLHDDPLHLTDGRSAATRMNSSIRWRIEFSPVVAVEPEVDGRLLSELVTEFELAHGFKPAGGYGGLMPDNFREFDPHRYFTGGSSWRYDGQVSLLACGSCGDVGCWPIDAMIEVSSDTITWSAFNQPHRPERAYAGFGPFKFDAKEYRAAIGEIMAGLDRAECSR